MKWNKSDALAQKVTNVRIQALKLFSSGNQRLIYLFIIIRCDNFIEENDRHDAIELTTENLLIISFYLAGRQMSFAVINWRWGMSTCAPQPHINLICFMRPMRVRTSKRWTRRWRSWVVKNPNAKKHIRVWKSSYEHVCTLIRFGWDPDKTFHRRRHTRCMKCMYENGWPIFIINF